MRKIIGIGETVLDIIFKGEQPTAAVPGGSVFNGIISLARTGVPVSFMSELGKDKVGEIILSFLKENGVDYHFVDIYSNGKSPVSLAFLDEHNDAQYIFYKDYPNNRLNTDFPSISPDDVVMYGSYFALNPVLRSRMTEFLEHARNSGAILYYDLNFRSNHKNEIVKLTPAIIENFEYADIVRGSQEDFSILYGLTEADEIYKAKVGFYCSNFILTRGNRSVQLRTKNMRKDYPIEKIEVVSSIGAGDNFNAGFVFGLLQYHILRNDIAHLKESDWDKMVRSGLSFSAESCANLNNYVSKEWAQRHRYTESIG